MKHIKLFENYYGDDDEQVEYLYHGTLAENEADIKRSGLTPRIGQFVRDMYAGEYEAAGIDIDDEENLHLVFFADAKGLRRSTTAIIHMIANKLGVNFHKVTPDDIEKYGMLLCVEKDYSMYHKPEDDDGYEDHPMTVEPGDYYSYNTVYGFTEMLKGKELMEFLKQHDALL